jgi:hypothetical protein
MKKIFTILAIAAVSTSAFAQTHDLSIVFDNYATGSTNAISTFNADMTITNEGSTTLAIGDTIGVGAKIDGNFYSLAGTPNAYSQVTLSAALAPAGTLPLAVGSLTLTFPQGVTTANVCAVAFSQDRSSIPFDAFTATSYAAVDVNPSDNESCSTFNKPVGVQESLNKLSEKMYVANGELIFENSDYNFEEAAQVSVMDISGRTIVSTSIELNDRNTISLAGQTTGIYFVQLTVGDKVSTAKVFVK